MWVPADVTAVVTCFESGTFLRRALESIRKEGPIRIVLVDDGSTSCMCRQIAHEFEHLVRVDRVNGGQPAALNTGVSHVRTALISFLDDDDEWLPGKTLRHLHLLNSTSADIVVGGVRNVRENREDGIRETVFPATRLLGASLMLTQAVNRVGQFAEHTRHHAIVDWWSRAERIGLVRVSDNAPVLLRRIHGGNSGFLHREAARADLLHHVRNHARHRKNQ